MYDIAHLLKVENSSTASNVPDVCTALLLFLTLPVTVATAERSFSKLKLLNTYLRNTMSQTTFRNLSILSIEKDRAQRINVNEILRSNS